MKKQLIALSFMFMLMFSSITSSFAGTLDNVSLTPDPIFTEVIDNALVTQFESLPNTFRVPVTSDSPMLSSDSLAMPQSILRSPASNGWKDYKLLDSGWYKKNKRMGWHPQFPREQKVDFYYFASSKTTSMGISIGGDYISFGVSKETSKAAGYGVKADSSIWTRPRVYGDVKYYEYHIKEYNGAGILIDEYDDTIYTVDRTYIKAEPYNN